MIRTVSLPGLLPLLALLLPPAFARAQGCASQTNAGADFAAYDAATGQLISGFLCVGRPVRLRDRSGKNLDPAQIYYRSGPTIACGGFTDTTTTFVPATPGPVVITQNTQNPGGATQSILFTKTYEVLATPPPPFEVSTCVAGFVRVTITDASYSDYSVRVGTAAPVAAPRNVARDYPVGNGPNTVVVTGRYAQANLCEGSSSQPFVPLPAPQRPVLTALTLAAGDNAEFTFTALQPEYRYQLQVAEAGAPGGYRTLAPVPAGGTSFTLPAAPPLGCFRLLLQDQCQPPATNLTSNEICAVQLNGAALNGSNRLSWTSAGRGPYTLTRTEGGGTSVVLPLPGSATSYTDAAVSCGTTYQYRVSVRVSGTASVSNEVSLTALSNTPPARPRLWAGFNLRNQVELRATVPGLTSGGRLSYQRNGTPLAATPARTLLDSLTTPDPAVPLCYTVDFEDACGNRAPGGAGVCVVQLAATPSSNGPEIRLNWSELTVTGPDPAAPAAYRVQRLAADNTVASSVVAGTNLTYLDLLPPTDQQAVRYRIEATGAGLTEPSYSNLVEVLRPAKLVLPTAFTPNGDGLNDVLELKGRFFDDFRFTVIDRNGQTVFQTTDRARTWDGRINGAAPVPGAYAWQFEALDQRGQRVKQYGTVTILR